MMEVRISTKQDFSDVKNILIRGTNWVGDVIMTLPAIAAVRKTFPLAKISILVKPWVADIFELCPDIDEVILFHSPGIHSGVTGILRLARELERREFGISILLQNAIEAAIITWLAHIPIRIGYNTDVRGFLLTHSVQRSDAIKRAHQIDYYLEMVESIGCQSAGKNIHLKLKEDYRDLGGKLLHDYGIGRDQCLIGIAPGATYGPAKKWFPERFALVADRLISDFSAQVILLGSDGDKEATDSLQGFTNNSLVNLAGKTKLKEAIALIGRCNLFISNDSGLMHVAGAVGIPTVAIFGSTNPVTTSPVGDKSRVIYKGVDCGPCLKKVCSEDFKCMDLIGIEDVYLVARKLLEDEGFSKVI